MVMNMNTGTVSSLDLFGQGIIKSDGKLVFVKNALPGETVEYNIIREDKRFIKASASRIINKSSHRLEPVCPYYGKCGGCTFQHSDYETELTAKENHVLNLFRRIAGIDATDVFSPLEGKGKIYNYRNKVTWHVKNGSLGFYEAKSHKFLSIDTCPLLDSALSDASQVLSGSLLENIKEISLRCNEAGDIIMALSGRPAKEEIDKIFRALPNLKGIDIGIKQYGDRSLTMSLGDKIYQVPPGGFFQVNTAAAKSMLDYGAELLREHLTDTQETIVDLYCGVGVIGIYWGDLFKKVVGIESFQKSVELARHNLVLNGLKGEYIAAKAETGFYSLLREIKNISLIVLDPPRSGLNRDLIDDILSAAPPYIMYISCDPATLCRDLKYLSSVYKLLSVKPFNLFPRTSHVETVVLMSKVKE